MKLTPAGKFWLGYLALIIILIIWSIAGAYASDWSKKDTVRESIYIAVSAADWAQTRYIAKHPSKFRETNSMIGAHPSISKVNNYFVGMIATHALIAELLPNGRARAGWQIAGIAWETMLVLHNHEIGINFNF